MKTEPAVEETISQSEPQLQNTDVGPSHKDEASAATSASEHQQPEPPDPSRTSTGSRKQPHRFGELIPTNSLKKGCDGFKEASRKLEVFFIKVSKNKRRTQMTNFVANRWVMATKLNSIPILFWRYLYLIDLSAVSQK